MENCISKKTNKYSEYSIIRTSSLKNKRRKYKFVTQIHLNYNEKKKQQQ